LEATGCLLLQLQRAKFLGRFLNEILRARHNTGVHVVATICDMDANNVKVLILLDAARWKPFFKFQNQDDVTVSDPPHHLKCTIKLFLKYDVQFESGHIHNQHPITKCKHILNLEQCDKQNTDGLFYKLIPAHLYPVAHDANESA
jgi:hypothetical protein